MKTVLFVPGGMEDINSRDYKSLLEAIEAKGYEAEFVSIKWLRTTIDNWVAEFENTYKKYDPKNTILAGFSWGAMTAFVAAAKRPPTELWLFSLSPYFTDDQHLKKLSLKKYMPRYLGVRRFKAFKKLNFDNLSKSIKCPTLIFIGDDELLSVKHRCQVAAKKIMSAKLIEVPRTKHKIDDPNYIAAIQENI